MSEQLAALGTAQWRLADLQMVNWGGFHGHHTVSFHHDVTLISGASGTGKSTLMDAYIAVMMPASVPFNGASNDAVSGRARTGDQRNILTYVRGKRDSTRDGDELTDQVLRGEGGPTWSALAVAFVDDSGRRFTAVRTYWAPATARVSSDVSVRMFTATGQLRLTDVEPFAAARFDPRAMRARFADLTHHDTVTSYMDTLHTRLGIGAAGGGERAQRLQARIQAGHQVRNVDSLYKEMVLEPPVTFAAAARALHQFHSLDQAYLDLETDGQKKDILDQIGALHADRVDAAHKADTIAELGVATGAPGTVVHTWAAGTELNLLDSAEAAAAAGAGAKRDEVAAAELAERAAAAEVADLDAQIRDNGGADLERLGVAIDDAVAARDRAIADRATFAERVAVLGLDVSDRDELAAAKVAAATFLATVDRRGRNLLDERDIHVEALPALRARRNELAGELASLQRRDGNVPSVYDDARRAIAGACGLTPSQLPFAAELVDVAPAFEQWRTAAEVTLRPVALTMLVDVRRQQHLRTTIDSMRLNVRINFDGVDLNTRADTPTDTRRISGRLIYRDDSPFIGWVKARISRAGTDHVCVDSPAQLGGGEARVTVAGQTAQGRRGAHGRSRGQTDVLGFSNEVRRAQLGDDIATVDADIASHEQQRDRLDREATSLHAAKAAHQAVADTAWDSIDVGAADRMVKQLQDRRQHLLDHSDVLTELQHAKRQAEQRRDEAVGCRALAGAAADTYEKELDQIRRRTHELRTSFGPVDLNSLDAAQRNLLDETATELSPAPDRQQFARLAEQVRVKLLADGARSRDTVRRTGNELSLIFERFSDRWPDPSRGTGPDSYPDYAAIYDSIVTHGLYQRRREFMRHFQTWSGTDLKLLGDAYETALADMDDRLDQINLILAGLPFGAGRDRLRINVRRLQRAALVEFRRELRDLSSNVADDWSDEEQTEARFRRLRNFMGRLEPDAPARADLLDVRRHVEVSASRVDVNGHELSTYSALGGKSGGESQELMAFILGAALRYQLGDETANRPTFAPVFLDEAFIKADGEFAGRSVAAWTELGFQLVIAAPLDKVTALEPYCDKMMAVTKNHRLGYSYADSYDDAEPAVGR